MWSITYDKKKLFRHPHGWIAYQILSTNSTMWVIIFEVIFFMRNMVPKFVIWNWLRCAYRPSYYVHTPRQETRQRSFETMKSSKTTSIGCLFEFTGFTVVMVVRDVMIVVNNHQMRLIVYCHSYPEKCLLTISVSKCLCAMILVLLE